MDTKEFLTLYHGTTFSRAQEIARTGKISNCAVSMMNVSDELKTTKGYVYLTSNPGNAAYYGKILAVQYQEASLCIYKITIARAALETDYDELRMRYDFPADQIVSPEDGIDITQSCRTAECLTLGIEVMHKLTLATRSAEGSALIRLRRRRCLDDAITLASELPWQAISPPES